MKLFFMYKSFFYKFMENFSFISPGAGPGKKKLVTYVTIEIVCSNHSKRSDCLYRFIIPQICGSVLLNLYLNSF